MDRPEYVHAMQDLRKSNAAQPHKDKRAEARKGWGKGGRAAVKNEIEEQHHD